MNSSEYIDVDQIAELKRIVGKIADRNDDIRKLVFDDLIKRTKKNLRRFYTETSFARKDIDLSNLKVDDLVSKKIFGIMSKKEERFTPTIKALLMVSYGIMNPIHSVNEMLEDFNKKFFESIMEMSEEPITSKEKAIIIGLLGINALSDQYSLKINEVNKKHIEGIVNLAAEFIRGLGPAYDDGKLNKLWGREIIGEGPVLGEMRRLDDIQIHTEGLYRKIDKPSRHYIDILIDDEVDMSRLTYLLKRTFDRRTLNAEERKKLKDTLDKIGSYEFKIFKNDPPFDGFEIRKQIKRCIESNI